MKKSEILGKIWVLLYQETDLYEDDLKILAEKVLDVVEAAGMKPEGYLYEDGDIGSEFRGGWEDETK